MTKSDGREQQELEERSLEFKVKERRKEEGRKGRERETERKKAQTIMKSNMGLSTVSVCMVCRFFLMTSSYNTSKETKLTSRREDHSFKNSLE